MNNDSLSLYPYIDEALINALMKDFPNKLPEDKISEFDLGMLIGIQKVITKLKFEKDYQDNYL